MFAVVKRIIKRMLDFYRRVWQAFLAACIGSVGIAAYLFKDYRVGFIIMLIVSLICLVVTLIGLYYDYRDARRKDKEAKAPSIYEKKGINTF